MEARPFRIAQATAEAEGIRSLVLAPVDAQPVPGFAPGQHVTVEVAVPGQARPLVRCYSLSALPNGATYRLTVKAERGTAEVPAGVVSTHLVDHAREGDVVQVRPPSGTFVPDASLDPLVLIAGGIGITPLRVMFEQVTRDQPDRQVWLFWSVRNGAEHPLRAELEQVAAAAARGTLVVAYTQPNPGDVAGQDFERSGRLSASWIKQRLLRDGLPEPRRPFSFYLCGPPGMLSALVDDLRGEGVDPKRVHLEAFGPQTVRGVRNTLRRARLADAPEAEPGRVTFSRSNKTVDWDPTIDSLLDLGQAHDVWIPFACAAGSCGTCLTKVTQGQVVYDVPPEFPSLREGTCLPCIGRPSGDVTLEM